MDSSGDSGLPARAEPGPGLAGSPSAAYLAYFARAPLAAMVVDALGRYVEVNPAACQLTGYTQAELLAMSLTDLLAEGSRDDGLRHFALLQRVGQASGEFLAIRKDGSHRWVTCDAVKISEDRFLAFKVDTTNRRIAESALRESEERLRIAAKAAQFGTYDHDFVTSRLIWSPELKTIWGLGPEDPPPPAEHFVHEGVHPDDRASVAVILRESLNPHGNGILRIEHRIIRPDGSVRWISQHGQIYFAEAGETRRAVRAVGTVVDISDRKRSEERIHLLAKLLDTAPTATTVHDASGKFLYANEMALKLHGYSREEFLQLNLHELDTPDSARLIEARVREITNHGAASFEVRHYRKNGTTLPLHVDTKLARWEEQDVYLSVASDISDLKRTEQTLREREARLRAILNAANESVFLIDRDGIVLECNETTASRLGKTIEDLLGKSIFDFLPPELAASRRAAVAEVLERHGPVQFQDQRAGVWFEHTIYPVFDDSGAILEFAIFGRDISVRKRSEEQLLLQSMVLDQIQDRVTVTDLQGVVTHVNDAECRTLKRTRESLLGQSVLTYGEDPGRGATQLDIIGATLSRGQWRGEVVNYASDGTERIMDCRTSLVKDDDGRPVAMCGIATDITDRKRAEWRMARDLDAMNRLQKVGLLFAQADNLTAVLTEIVDAAISITNADFGNIQLIDPTSGQLQIAAHRGFPQWWLDYWNSVTAGQGTCGTARESVERTIVEDVEQSPIFVGTRALHIQRRAHVRAVQSTPLVSRSGRLLGMVSTHWRAPHRPDERTLRLLELLARQAADIIERADAEEKLRESEQRLRLALESTGIGTFSLDFASGSGHWSPELMKLYGLPATGSLPLDRDQVPIALHPDDRSAYLTATTAANDPRGTGILRLDHRIIRADHSIRWLHIDGQTAFVGEGKDRRPWRTVGIVADITDRKQAEHEKLEMERRLLHAQKLESLGILAGGIAHDFNNILAGIMGYAELLKAQLPPTQTAREDVEVIKRAVQRAADLTRQMLAYSGKGKFVVERVDLSENVADTRKILEVTVSKKATLTYHLASGLPKIDADPGQLHQIVLNLVINASEAIGEESGVIAITTHATRLSDREWIAARTVNEARAGQYVCLEVADTGCGMSCETLAKIFDPFFTTKFTGRGLGLAALHGIVRGHKGGLRVTSQPGEGTTFQVFFPVSSVGHSEAEVEPQMPLWRGSGTILVVEDEQILRDSAQRMIEHVGFSVITARDGDEAIRVYGQRRSDIVCVLLDLTMPKMGGDETLRELRKIDPEIPVILSSGFHEDCTVDRFAELKLSGFIQKPYQLATLTAALRNALANGTHIDSGG